MWAIAFLMWAIAFLMWAIALALLAVTLALWAIAFLMWAIIGVGVVGAAGAGAAVAAFGGTSERSSKLGDSDKTKFIISLQEPVRLNLISTEEAQKLMRAVESGQMPIKEAIQMVENVVKSAKM